MHEGATVVILFYKGAILHQILIDRCQSLLCAQNQGRSTGHKRESSCITWQKMYTQQAFSTLIKLLYMFQAQMYMHIILR